MFKCILAKISAAGAPTASGICSALLVPAYAAINEMRNAEVPESIIDVVVKHPEVDTSYFISDLTMVQN
jgi:hypothetical protein